MKSRTISCFFLTKVSQDILMQRAFFFQERTQNFGHISQTDSERSVRGVARTVQLFAGEYYWNGLALNPQLTTGLPHK